MARTERVTIRLSEDELKVLSLRAKKSKMDTSTFIRSLLLGDDLSGVSEEEKGKEVINKYERDLIGLTTKSAILIQHLTETLGDASVLEMSDKQTKKWIKNKYIIEGK